MRGGTPGCPDIPDWLAGNVPEGGRVGIDPFVHTVRPPECRSHNLRGLIEGNVHDLLFSFLHVAAPAAYEQVTTCPLL